MIFVASYTANIAALFAGAFFERVVDVNDRSVRKKFVFEKKTTSFLMGYYINSILLQQQVCSIQQCFKNKNVTHKMIMIFVIKIISLKMTVGLVFR